MLKIANVTEEGCFEVLERWIPAVSGRLKDLVLINAILPVWTPTGLGKNLTSGESKPGGDCSASADQRENPRGSQSMKPKRVVSMCVV